MLLKNKCFSFIKEVRFDNSFIKQKVCFVYLIKVKVHTNLKVINYVKSVVFTFQNSFVKSSSGVASPTTVDSSKESSPSCKSEESHFGNSSAWQSHAAGEAMANR